MVTFVVVKRFAHALTWLIAFFSESVRGLYRECLHWPLQPDERMYLAIDASIWGGGAILVVNGCVDKWLTATWTRDDHQRFSLTRGESGNMSFWEALMLLIAARCLLPCAPFIVRIKADNVAALRLAMKLGSKSSILNKVGMELALDQALDRYNLSVCQHIPGVSNVMPDALSRIASGQGYTVPAECKASAKIAEPKRDSNFWKCQKPRVHK